MHTLSSASRTCMARSSAVECTATVLMPISLQARCTRRAISPRLAIRILSNIWARLLDHHQRLAKFHGLGIGDEYFLDGAAMGRGDGVHHLHGLHNQNGLTWFHFAAHFYKRRGAGFRGEISCAHHGR